jgi:hypothetical protein
MSAFSNLLIPAVLFFALGFIARLIKSDLRFPPDLAKILSIYLLVSIGLHGGVELAHADLGEAFAAVFWALVLGLTLPIIGYGLLIATKRVEPLDAAAIAAHYGSVSAGTFLTAIAFLGSQGVDYERYPLIMLAVMESPAIVVGLLLASWTRGRAAKVDSKHPSAPDEGGNGRLRELLHEAFTNGSVVLLIGAMVIGAIANPKAMESLEPFTTDIFMGMLCLFLLEMGMEAGRRFGDFKRVGMVLGGFGLVMPLIGGVIGVLVGSLILDFGIGGTTLVGVLGASASYIAVPPAMRLAIPEANPSFYLTLSLGVTFPFNVVIGIPLYYWLAQMLAGGA